VDGASTLGKGGSNEASCAKLETHQGKVHSIARINYLSPCLNLPYSRVCTENVLCRLKEKDYLSFTSDVISPPYQVKEGS
jgi:hypothetical protein